MKLSKNTKRELAEAYGNTLIKVAKDTMSSEELDNVLLAMFNFFADISSIDYKMVRDIEESIEVLEGKKINKLEIELNRRLQKMKTIREKYNESEENQVTSKDTEAKRRLAEYFNIDKSDKRSTRSTRKTNDSLSYSKDTEFEVHKTHRELLLVALNNSFIAEQSELNKIKSLAKTSSLTEAIKAVIPKKKYSKVLHLVNIQRSKYEDYQKRQGDLYL